MIRAEEAGLSPAETMDLIEIAVFALRQEKHWPYLSYALGCNEEGLSNLLVKAVYAVNLSQGEGHEQHEQSPVAVGS